MSKKNNKISYVIMELSHHLPYSIIGVISAIIMMAVLTFIAKIAGNAPVFPSASSELFHVFHPAHVLFSAVATTAMFWKHDNRSVLKAAIIGTVGSVAICGVSDIVIPFLGGIILGQDMHIHICLFQRPGMILPFAALGVFSGFMVTKAFEHSTEYSPSSHVFLSSAASLLYLISFGLVDWIHMLPGVFCITIIAVVFPCCLSDIVFPLMCTHRYCRHRGAVSE